MARASISEFRDASDPMPVLLDLLFRRIRSLAIVLGMVTAMPAASVRVACLGDSLTAGAKVQAATEAYPIQMKAILGPDYDVKNFGRSGATLWHGGTPHAAQQLPAVREFNPNIAVVIFGANDVRSRDADYWSHFSEFEHDLTRLLDSLLAMPELKHIILCTPPAHVIDRPGMTAERRESVAERIPRIEQVRLKVMAVAKNYQGRGVELLDLYPMTAAQPDVFNPDGVHFKAEGYRLLAESIAPRIEAWRPLFKGCDSKDWRIYPESGSQIAGSTKDAGGRYQSMLGANYDPPGVFSVVMENKTPAFRISGEELGTISTRASCSNYFLRLEFKWGKRPWVPCEIANTLWGSGIPSS